MTVTGFTATREGLTDAQLAWLYTTLESGQVTGVHHGACVGGDAAVHAAALEAQIPINVWPPVNPRYLATECVTPHPLVTVHPAMPYLDRDRQIVHETVGLIALPKHDVQPPRELWGGTWYTVDFAERMNRPVVICNPKGVIQQRFPTAMRGQHARPT